MHPTGLEPATKASEAYVLSIRLRVQLLQNCYIASLKNTTLLFSCLPKNTQKALYLAKIWYFLPKKEEIFACMQDSCAYSIDSTSFFAS